MSVDITSWGSFNFWLGVSRFSFTVTWFARQTPDLNSSDWLKAQCIFQEIKIEEWSRVVCVHTIVVFVTGFLISFYFFHIFFIQRLLIFFRVILIPSCFSFSYLSPCFSFLIQSTESLFVWKYWCENPSNHGLSNSWSVKFLVYWI